MTKVKPTLCVLAAGMGSRYGGLKQMDKFGPSGESIIDYSIYDAIRAGFGKVVFIIREYFEADFRASFDKKLAGKIEVAYVTQELHKIPDGLVYIQDRQKPWGTAHALWMAGEVVNEPFGVINADDFYGRDSYQQLANYLTDHASANYAIVAYYLQNTLSEHGHVNRGVCSTDANGKLKDIIECTKISCDEDGTITYPSEDGTLHTLQPNDIVSMNMMGFRASYFDYCERMMVDFLIERGHEEKSEFYIPTLLDHLIKTNTLQVDVINTTSNWFGVTYPEDKPSVIAQLNELITAGEYPENLWG